MPREKSMLANPTFESFAAVVGSVFGVDAMKIRRATTAADIDGWDSVSHATLIMTLEEQYTIRFSDDEIYTLGDAGELYDRIIEYISADRRPDTRA